MSYSIFPLKRNSSGVGDVRLVDSDGNSVTDHGSDPIHAHLTDDHGHRSRVDFVGKTWTTDPIRTHGTNFVGTTVDTNFWTVSNSGTSSSATQATGLLTLTSGTSAAGYATLSSFRNGRFIFFNPINGRFALRIPDVTEADVTRRWGMFTHTNGVPQDGYYFELSPAGVLSLKAVNATSSTLAVASGSFNGAVASYTLDSNVHAFEIQYYVMEVNFLIDGVLIHSAVPTTTNLTGTYTLPLSAVAINGASGGESGQIEVWAANALRLGPASTLPRSYYHAAGTTAGVVLKRGAGQTHAINVAAVTNNAVVTLYDNVAASGTVLYSTGAMPAQAQPFTIDLNDIQFELGLTLVVSGANASVVVVYE